jgi:hypothetical protein
VTTQYQKQQEIEYATKASELLNTSWQVEAAPDEISWPDLIINDSSFRFGLEVRELYKDEGAKGSAKKAKEKYNKRQVSNLAQVYYENSLVPIKVDLLGNIDHQTEILRVLTNEIDQLCESDQLRLEPYDGCVIYIRKLPEQFQKYSRWNYVSDHVGWVDTLDKSLLERTILKKADNLSKYRAHVPDVRLLIVSNRIYNSGKAQLMNTIKCDAKGFNAVYYLSYPEGAWQLSR